MTYYKVLRANRASWYDETFIWPIGQPVEVKGATRGNPCGIGVHLAKTMDAPFRLNAGFPCSIWEVESLGPILGEDDEKIRVGKARLVKEITPEWVIAVNDFLLTIPEIPWFQNANPNGSWELFDSRDAAWDAARDAAWDAAGDAARDAVRAAAKAAAWDAAGDAAGTAAGAAVWDAAWDAAGTAVWDAARGAVWVAARVAAGAAAKAAVWDAARAAAGAAAGTAAGDAARAAALMACVLVCEGTSLEPAVVLSIKTRWEVWQKGYGLLCDIDGQLYVYRKP